LKSRCNEILKMVGLLDRKNDTLKTYLGVYVSKIFLSFHENK